MTLSGQRDAFIGSGTNYDAASIVLYGAPYDGTTSGRPGTRFAPAAIRAESQGIETYSPYQDRDLEEGCDFFDSGDVDVCPGSSERTLSAIRERTAVILADGKFPFLVGVEHLVTLGAVESVVKKYPDLHMIHFDAHADLRQEYLEVELSHACVIRRCHDQLGDGTPECRRIHQFGIRSGTREEFRFAASHTRLRKFDFNGLTESVVSLNDRPVYFTLDLDVLDPGEFPGTGTPEAGGVTFVQLMTAIDVVFRANVVGCDVTELAPDLDGSRVSTALACKVVREMLLAIARGRGPRVVAAAA
ncbi:MAG: agmatinase [Planctomycetia bacterium]|nr:agmatinase [Planctomycetia bacterium]